MATSGWDGPSLGSTAFQQLELGKDCELFADFVAAALIIHWSDIGGSATPIKEYLRSILPAPESQKPSTLDLLRWYDDLHLVEGNSFIPRTLNASFLDQVNASNPSCIPKACQGLVRTIGLDSDLAGIDQSIVSYVVGTSLVTIYVVILSLPLSWVGTAIQIAAIRESRGDFKNMSDKPRDFVVITALVSVFAFCPVLLLSLVLGGGRHRRRRRWLVYVATGIQYILWAAVVGTAVGSIVHAERPGPAYAAPGALSNGWFSKHTFSELVGEQSTAFQAQHCRPALGGGSEAIALSSGAVFGTGLGPLFRVVLAAFSSSLVYLGFGSRFMRYAYVIDRALRHITAVCAFINMWASLWMLLYIRWAVNQSPWSDSLSINEWSFGQILSTLTWIPVFVEVGYLALCEYISRAVPQHGHADFCSAVDGMETALNGRVPEDYTVVLYQDDEKDDGMRGYAYSQNNRGHQVNDQSAAD
ncbi:hypothetical protein PG989_002432 [Apiospora arundinis]